MISKQFTIYLENKAGVLAEIMEKLRKENINIDGISVSGSTDVALVQLVTSAPRKTIAILKKYRVSYTIQDVIIVGILNQPGSLFELVSKLAKAKVNINYVYATGCDGRKDCKAYAVISAENLSAVEKLAEKLR